MMNVDGVPTNELNQRLATLVTQSTGIVMSAVAKAHQQDGSEICSVPMVTAVVGLKGVAIATGKAGVNGDKDEMNAVTDDHILFAALLTVSCVSCNNSNHTVEIGPATIRKAAEDFKTLTGRTPDAFLNPSLVEIINAPVTLDPTQAAEFAQFLPAATTKH